MIAKMTTAQQKALCNAKKNKTYKERNNSCVKNTIWLENTAAMLEV